MAINGVIRTFNVAGVFDGALSRALLPVPRWPWPQPVNSVLAALDRGATAPGLIAALGAAGLDTEAVWTLSGEEGARDLRHAFARRGPAARLRSLLDGDDELVAQLEAWCARGGTVALVRPLNEQMDAAVEVIARQGAALLRRTGRWVARTDTGAAPGTAACHG